MADRMDLEGIAGFFGKADAVVAHSKAQLAGLSLKLFDVTLASLSEMMQASEDAHGSVAVQAADVCACRFGPGDLLHA